MMALNVEEGSVGLTVQTTVLLAACSGSHRSVLENRLEHCGFRVVIADSEKRAMEIALSGLIDIVVTGPAMPGLDGYALTRGLRQALPELPVILMSAGGARLSDTLLDCAMAMGEQSMREATPPARSTWNGLCSFSHARVAKLTPRELEVLRLVARGHGNKTIARQLSISPRTVENHRAQVMRKTDARSLADLVRLDLSLGEPQDAGPAPQFPKRQIPAGRR